MESTITSKGQATIPKAVRDRLRLQPGDRLKFFPHPDGTVVLLPRLPIAALRGLAQSGRPPASLAEMEEAPPSGAAERAGPVRKR